MRLVNRGGNIVTTILFHVRGKWCDFSYTIPGYKWSVVWLCGKHELLFVLVCRGDAS
jgi:hypothetical protein